MQHLRPSGLPWWLSGKASACEFRRCRFNPWVGKIPGEGNGNPFQYYCLENPMDRGACRATVHEVAKSQTRLSDSTTGPQTCCKKIRILTSSPVICVCRSLRSIGKTQKWPCCRCHLLLSWGTTPFKSSSGKKVPRHPCPLELRHQ